MRRAHVHLSSACALLALAFTWSATAYAQDFSYNPPGQLTAGSGTGRVDDTVYVPGMRYPVEAAPSFPNSQVWGRGGSQGGGGGQCDAENYSYPWWDNYCETRRWAMPLCPGGTGHQGQDIRPSTCEKDVHFAVAAEAGTITNIGSYSVSLTTDSGTRHRYLHMEPSSLQVSVNQRVAKGDRLGRVSNAFGGTPTTIHLHYDIRQNLSGMGNVYVPTYMSLVRSYEELIGMPAEPCGVISTDGGVIDDRDKCFRLAGNVRFWREVEGAGYNDRVYWTYAFTSANPGAWAQWDLDFEAAGEYTLEVYLTPTEATSERARYVVRHSDTMEELIVDLSADNDGWRSLGDFAFAQGGGQSLSVYDNTGEESDAQLKIPADAIRLTPVGATMEEDMGVIDPPIEDMGSDPVDMGSQVDMSSPLADMQGAPPTPAEDMGQGAPPAMDMSPVQSGDGDESPRTGSASSSTCGGCASSGGDPSPAGALLLLGVGAVCLRRRRQG